MGPLNAGFSDVMPAGWSRRCHVKPHHNCEGLGPFVGGTECELAAAECEPLDACKGIFYFGAGGMRRCMTIKCFALQHSYETCVALKPSFPSRPSRAADFRVELQPLRVDAWLSNSTGATTAAAFAQEEALCYAARYNDVRIRFCGSWNDCDLRGLLGLRRCERRSLRCR